MDNDTCSTCRFAEERPHYDVLFCHRFPPVNEQFPTTLRTAWCGEHVASIPTYQEGYSAN